ncbi:hypothetical protein TNCV_1554011 [Trichonephila clavipes]|nr:hypothetical protein TNCV_1554011 [Trichonephila clavipes]
MHPPYPAILVIAIVGFAWRHLILAWRFFRFVAKGVGSPRILPLEDNIRRVIADIRPQMLEKIIENWTSRLDYIRASRGSHMPEIIFKM